MATVADLLEAARIAQGRAYARYSGFPVGAALSTTDGAIYSGCNVENASYPVGTCAEAGAIAAMIAGGHQRIDAILVYGNGEALLTPCGACRQRIREFGSGSTRIHVAGPDGVRAAFNLDICCPMPSGLKTFRQRKPGRRDKMSNDVEAAAGYLQSRGVAGSVGLALVLAGNSGSPAEVMTETTTVRYEEIPGFPAGVAGGRIVVGTFEETRVAVLEGRTAYHQAGDAAGMSLPLRAAGKLGAKTLVVATTALSLQADIYPGGVALIADHINFGGVDPLVGCSPETRSVVMKDAYDQRLRRRLKAVGSTSGVATHEGVFLSNLGASSPTAAEARMAKILGADLIGTGIVPEVIVARSLGMRVAAVAVVTGFAAGIGVSTTPQGTLGTKDGALVGSIALRRLLRAFLRPAEE